VKSCEHPPGPGHRQWYRVMFASGSGYHLVEWCLICDSNARGSGRWAPRHQCPDDPDSLPVFPGAAGSSAPAPPGRFVLFGGFNDE
jgi:hypothetical protein